MLKTQNTLQKGSDVSKSDKKATSSKVTPNLQTQAATTRKRKLAENSDDIQTHDQPEVTVQSLEMLLRQCFSETTVVSETISKNQSKPEG